MVNELRAVVEELGGAQPLGRALSSDRDMREARLNQNSHASHGFRTGTCVLVKSLTLRETIVRL
jgi:hypothetical protein